jgi:hypothetical protein
MTTPCGDQAKLLHTELQVAIEALDAYRPPRMGQDETLRTRARKKLAMQLEAARRPFIAPEKP